MSSSFKKKAESSYLFGMNMPYIEALYETFLKTPHLLEPQWRHYFENLQMYPASNGEVGVSDQNHSDVIASMVTYIKQSNQFNNQCEFQLELANKQVSIQSLIAAYRSLGVKYAYIDPLKRREHTVIPELELDFYGLTQSDLNKRFSATNTYFTTEDTMTLRELLTSLQDTYCRHIGAEFMHISSLPIKRWIQEQLESSRGVKKWTDEQKKGFLERLTEAEGLERYLHNRYVGQKRFSLEGGESFIVCMHELVQYAGLCGLHEVVVGMAHRGRLNMLVNIMGKMPRDLFAEFEGQYTEELVAGDVKYHNGFYSDLPTSGGPVGISLEFNPSHLEIVNPVVEGSTRARQEFRKDIYGEQVMSVLVHGDSAFGGQGVVQETLNLAQTRGYGTKGTVHIVINNQIGFTTSDPRDMRSTLYCTDIVKMIEAPVFHVNGDDPEAVAFVTRLAIDYRNTFKKDVVIDLVCFRKLGHNEQDTPSLTQPLMYKSIACHPGVRQLYADCLIAQKVISSDYPSQRVEAYRELMNYGQKTVEPVLTDRINPHGVDWSKFLKQSWTDYADTAVPREELERLGEIITQVPEGFEVHRIVKKILADRLAMARGEMNLDWGMGEHLAFATLVNSGYAVRLTGEDSCRGTFSHRHAVLHDQKRERWDGGVYIPLEHISENQAPFVVIDSILSEEAVLGFEYGYATTLPYTLTIWEAQFGDFANGAQVVIDQFISSGEAKWGRQCGLVMMLPHGYEGQGPEHSSARIERFLQLCADTNMQVVQPTNAAQIFHVLRRQMLRSFRKPLVLFTPKSLLRNKQATSPITDFSDGRFLPVIPEVNSNINVSNVRRVILCSGKVYYDLVNRREQLGRSDVSIIRIEQLYPFPHKAFKEVMLTYFKANEIIWVQDEPQNQGPWFYVEHHIYEHMNIGQCLSFSGREASSSPAVGYLRKHQEQQERLLEMAFSHKLKIVLRK